ncbi:MAG: deoxyribodipyrimidine photo-lyase, partial [Pseudohongiellaceae bacterium]
MSRQLCWIRNDLRIHDNAALIQALARGPAVALYIACPGQWQRHHEAPVKLDFWRRNLELLQVELAKLRIPLVTARIEDYTAIPGFFESVLTQWQIQALHFNQEYPLNERQRDEAVSRVCRQHNVDVFAWQDQVLLSPEVISNQAGLPFRVFTPFSRKARELLQASDNFQPGPEKPVGNPHDLHLPQLPGQCELDEIDWPQAHDRWAR